MTKQEFQEFHGFDDEDMGNVEAAVKIFAGRITNIVNAQEKVKGWIRI